VLDIRCQCPKVRCVSWLIEIIVSIPFGGRRPERAGQGGLDNELGTDCGFVGPTVDIGDGLTTVRRPTGRS
jgi:hypothetical protein